MFRPLGLEYKRCHIPPAGGNIAQEYWMCWWWPEGRYNVSAPGKLVTLYPQNLSEQLYETWICPKKNAWAQEKNCIHYLFWTKWHAPDLWSSQISLVSKVESEIGKMQSLVFVWYKWNTGVSVIEASTVNQGCPLKFVLFVEFCERLSFCLCHSVLLTLPSTIWASCWLTK